MEFKQIEKEVDVNRIRHEGRAIWPILKSYLIGITGDFDVIKESTPSNMGILLRGLLFDLLSIRKLRRNRVWVFTNSERRYFINDTSMGRITTGLLKYLNGYLLFENPIPNGSTKAKLLQRGEKRIGMSWIFLWQFVRLKLMPLPQPENFDLLTNYLERDLGRLKSVYRRILAGAGVYGLLMRVFQPKAIFVVCYYSSFEVVLAAKKRGIPVIELQHGMLSAGHRAYYFTDPPDRQLLPDYFLSFGAFSNDILLKGKVFSEEQILTFGYPFLQRVDERLRMSDTLAGLRNSYGRLVCVTGQMEVTDTGLLEIVREACLKYPGTGFLFKPRYNKPGAAMDALPNFHTVEGINTYELLKFCDLHMTVYSTCAMESLFLGTPTISADIKGYYTRFLHTMLSDNPYNYVVRDAAGFNRVLGELEGREFDPAQVRHSIRNVFSEEVSLEAFTKFFKEVIKQEPDHQKEAADF